MAVSVGIVLPRAAGAAVAAPRDCEVNAKLGVFQWTAPAGRFTRSGSFWLQATVAADEGDAVYYTCDWGGEKPDDAKMHCSGHINRL